LFVAHVTAADAADAFLALSQEVRMCMYIYIHIYKCIRLCIRLYISL